MKKSICFECIVNGGSFKHAKYGDCIKIVPIEVAVDEHSDCMISVNAWSISKNEYICIDDSNMVEAELSHIIWFAYN